MSEFEACMYSFPPTYGKPGASLLSRARAPGCLKWQEVQEELKKSLGEERVQEVDVSCYTSGVQVT